MQRSWVVELPKLNNISWFAFSPDARLFGACFSNKKTCMMALRQKEKYNGYREIQ